jgi:hypothetical protein
MIISIKRPDLQQRQQLFVAMCAKMSRQRRNNNNLEEGQVGQDMAGLHVVDVSAAGLRLPEH